MEGENQLQISAADQETLQHLADLIHLFHHRNINQHRRSVWWRHFSSFRRQLNHVVQDVTRLNEVPATHLARSRKKALDLQTREGLKQRLDFWQRVLVPKWQLTFSQIVADGRFAMLGLVLMAILAQVCRITEVTAAFEDLGQAEVERALEKFAKDGWEIDESGLKGEASRANEDLGEVVSREVEGSDEVGGGAEGNGSEGRVVDQVQSLEEATPAVLAHKKKASKRSNSSVETPIKKKKKRKKGNAIDDLFSSFD